ncbi:hypothetical protein T492DRAFT_920236, partial [Pavlovales sp. CCMP2436]
VTVIERRTGSVYKAGGSRGINDPEWAMTKMLVPIRALVSGSESKRVQNDVVAIDAASKTISLSSGGTLEYDYAVVAVGAQNLSPAEPPLGVYNLAGIREHYEHVSAAIKAAKKIVVVGGGAVGMETAGYTRDHIDASVSMTVMMPESSMEPGSKLIKVKPPPPARPLPQLIRVSLRSTEPGYKLIMVGLPPGTPEGHADVVLANLITLAAGKPASKEWVTPLTKLQIAIPITKKVGGSAIGVPNFAAGLKGGAFEFFAFTHWMSTGQKASKALFVTEADETAIVPLAEAPAKSPAVAPAKSP